MTFLTFMLTDVVQMLQLVALISVPLAAVGVLALVIVLRLRKSR